MIRKENETDRQKERKRLLFDEMKGEQMVSFMLGWLSQGRDKINNIIYNWCG